jgi:hypothetical protein
VLCGRVVDISKVFQERNIGEKKPLQKERMGDHFIEQYVAEKFSQYYQYLNTCQATAVTVTDVSPFLTSGGTIS